MFGLGGKTADDKVWIAVAKTHVDRLTEIKNDLAYSSETIEKDLLEGWRSTRPQLEELPSILKECKEIQRTFKSIGKPSYDSKWRAAEHLYSMFMDELKVAANWGRYHLNDQSGGPGHRARTETGRRLRSAVRRVSNNGAQYADHANKARMLLNSVISEINMDPLSMSAADYTFTD